VGSAIRKGQDFSKTETMFFQNTQVAKEKETKQPALVSKFLLLYSKALSYPCQAGRKLTVTYRWKPEM